MGPFQGVESEQPAGGGKNCHLGHRMGEMNLNMPKPKSIFVAKIVINFPQIRQI